MTTVFKRRWAWYFRKRDGTSVLDTSHLREYTDLGAFRSLVTSSGLRIAALERRLLWFPSSIRSCSAPGGRLASHRHTLRALRAAKVPIPGYYSLEVVLEH